MLDGKVIPRGFGILRGSYQTFKNPLTQLPLGERGEVSLVVTRHDWRGDRFIRNGTVMQPVRKYICEHPGCDAEIKPGSKTHMSVAHIHAGYCKCTRCTGTRHLAA